MMRRKNTENLPFPLANPPHICYNEGNPTEQGKGAAMIIQKYTETMTPRERVRRTFDFEKTDRVSIGYETNHAITSSSACS